MFKVLILISGIFLGSPFTGNISSDPVFTSKNDCMEYITTKDYKYQTDLILKGLKDSGHSKLVTTVSCVPEDRDI